MKLLLPFLLCILAIPFLQSCKKDDNNNPSQPIIVRYRVSTTAPLKDTSVNVIAINYVNGAGQNAVSTSLIKGMTIWTQTDTITTSTRPLTLRISSNNTMFLTAPGDVTTSIEVNGGVVAFDMTSSLNLGGNYKGYVATLNYDLP